MAPPYTKPNFFEGFSVFMPTGIVKSSSISTNFSGALSSPSESKFLNAKFKMAVSTRFLQNLPLPNSGFAEASVQRSNTFSNA